VAEIGGPPVSATEIRQVAAVTVRICERGVAARGEQPQRVQGSHFDAEDGHVLTSAAMANSFEDAARKLPHRREPKPLHFPVEQKVPDSSIHFYQRVHLFQALENRFRDLAQIGCDHFVYFDASDPKRCLAPDLFVKSGLEGAEEPITSWKVWERGVPELCIEIDSPNDEKSWKVRFERYRVIGTKELVRFDPQARPGKRLRVWDRIEEDLVERAVIDDATPCIVLGLHWVVRAIEKAPVALRLAEDPAGVRLVETPAEAAERAREAADRAREASDRAREASDKAREDAERRIAELEAELRRRGG
jgi:hypothetical protein